MTGLIELILAAAAVVALGTFLVWPEWRLHPLSDIVVYVSGITLLVLAIAFFVQKEFAAPAPQASEAVLVIGTASLFLKITEGASGCSA